MQEIYLNNRVELSGQIITNFEFSHEFFGEKFYICHVATKRTSGTDDVIPVMVSDRMVNVKKSPYGKCVYVNGHFRSYSRNKENGKHILILSVFARGFEYRDEVNEVNSIEFIGYICTTPTYRKTPLGREISDMIVAVNRMYHKSDYLPCITWGRNARYCENLEVGTKVKMRGRVQSREYRKRVGENEYENRVAYEVSVSKIEKIQEEK